jgi:hypothetical protein
VQVNPSFPVPVTLRCEQARPLKRVVWDVSMTLTNIRAIVSIPSSNGCRSTSSTCRLHSGSSSRQRTPWWARGPSPGMGIWPRPISPTSAMVWWGARPGRVVTTAMRDPQRSGAPWNPAIIEIAIVDIHHGLAVVSSHSWRHIFALINKPTNISKLSFFPLTAGTQKYTLFTKIGRRSPSRRNFP